MIKYLNNSLLCKNPLHEAISSGYLYNPKIQGKMRAVVFMSGSGSNFKRIYEYQQELEDKMRGYSPFEISVVFTDTEKGYENAGKIIHNVTGKYDTIPRIFLDPKREILKMLGKNNISKEEKRRIYDKTIIQELEPNNVNFGILAGYMRLLSSELINRLVCINVHPAPLNIIDPFTGKRRFTGDNAVRDQILAGRDYLQSTVNVAREGADTGEILMLSKYSHINLEGHTIEQLSNYSNLLEEIVERNQTKLKEIGDLDIFPKTVVLAAVGTYRFNLNGKLYFDNNMFETSPEKVSHQDYEEKLEIIIQNPT